MRTPAQNHAASLVRQYGPEKAQQIVTDKLNDAPFLVNGDRDFWIGVREALGMRPVITKAQR